MKGRIILLCTLTLFIFLSTPHVLAQPPSPPCAFYGYVNVGGKPAQDGLKITAVIAGASINWTTETKNGTYGWQIQGSSLFTIPSENASAPEKDGGLTGDSVEFYVDGVNTNLTATFDSGGAVRLDISTSEIPEYPWYAVTFLTVAVTGWAAFWIRRKGLKKRKL
jgi:hypothetical protein